MKKYTYSNPKWVLVGMVIPFLLFVFAMNSVFAYFTATSGESSDHSSTAIIQIGHADSASVQVFEKSVSVSLTEVLPGHTVKALCDLQNYGNMPCYVLVKCETILSETILDVKYLNLLGNNIAFNGSEYTTTATVMNSNETKKLNAEYTFKFYENWNDVQGATINFKFSAYAIQTTNLTEDATKVDAVATDILMNMATA